MAEKLKLYFLGSGAIAVQPLSALAASPFFELVGVGTQEDKPAGRSRKLTPTPVAEACRSLGLTAEKIASVNRIEFLSSVRERGVDMIVVIAFGQLLKDEILYLPRFGCINVHASLLPRYRGASPIASALLAMEKETGVTIMKMERGLDTGPIYTKSVYPIQEGDTYAQLESRLGQLAARILPDALLGIAEGRLQPVAQEESQATLCTKIRKGDGAIYWLNPAVKIAAKVRAYNPWPGARTVLHLADGRELQLTVNSARVRQDFSGQPGEVLKAGKKELVIGCGEHALEIVTLTVAGKREMNAASLLNGYNLAGAFAQVH